MLNLEVYFPGCLQSSTNKVTARRELNSMQIIWRVLKLKLAYVFVSRPRLKTKRTTANGLLIKCQTCFLSLHPSTSPTMKGLKKLEVQQWAPSSSSSSSSSLCLLGPSVTQGKFLTLNVYLWPNYFTHTHHCLHILEINATPPCFEEEHICSLSSKRCQGECKAGLPLRCIDHFLCGLSVTKS